MAVDSADEQTGGRRAALGVVLLTVAIDLLGFGLVLPLLQIYGRELGWPAYQIGLLQASYSAMQFLFVPIWGRISDRVGRRPVLLLGLAGSVVFYALFGWGSAIGDTALLFASRIGAGIAGATIATAQAYIADITPPQERTQRMALIGAAFGVGFTFGPALGAATVMIEIPGAVVSPMPGLLAAGLSLVALVVAVRYVTESLPAGGRPRDVNWFDSKHLASALATPTIGRLMLVYAAATFVLGCFESTLGLLNEGVLGLGKSFNLLAFCYTGLSLTIAQGFFVRRLSRVLEDQKLAALGLVLDVLGMAGLVAVVYTESWLLLAVVLPTCVGGFSFTNTAVQSMISRRSRPDEQGGVLGVNQSGAALARIVGPVVGTTLFGLAPPLPYLAGGLLAVLLLPLLVWLPAVRDAEYIEPRAEAQDTETAPA